MTAAACVLLLLAQQAATLEDALEAVEARPGERLPRVLGLEAARALGPGMTADVAARHILVAEAAGAHDELAAGLARLLAGAALDPAPLRPALAAAGRLPPRALERLDASLPATPELRRLLDAAADDDELAVAAGAIELAAPAWSPERLAARLEGRGVDPARAARLLGALRRARAPAPTYEALASLSALPDDLGPALRATLVALVARDLAAAEAALARAQLGAGPHGAVLASLGAAPPDAWDRAAPLVAAALLAAVEADDAPAITGALEAAGGLLLPEALPCLPRLLGHRSPAVRAAAASALGALGTRDARTIDPLLALLRDPAPAVAAAAHAALARRTGLVLPLRPDLWAVWRRGLELPADLAAGDEERLAEARAAAARRRARRPARGAP